MRQAAHATKITKLFYRLAITGVPVVVVWFIITALQNTDIEHEQIHDLIHSGPLIPFLVLNLAFLNWLTEAWKWKYMIRGFAKKSWSESYKAVLMGISLGFITPARVGDYLGKNLFLNNEDKTKGITTAIIAGIIQTIVTFIPGIAALFYLSSDLWPELNFDTSVLLMAFALCAALFFIFFLFFPSIIFYPFKKIKGLSSFITQVKGSFVQFTKRELLYCLGISFLRYFIFTLQFFLLLYWTGITENAPALVAKIAAVFFFSSCIPSFFLGKLGVRETFAVLLIGAPLFQTAEVIMASLLLWIINQVVPAVIGSFFVLTLKPKEEI